MKIKTKINTNVQIRHTEIEDVDHLHILGHKSTKTMGQTRK